MKLPRDLSGPELVKALERAGYRVTRQTGSHIRLTIEHPERHSITVPNHADLKVGTLSGILNEVARQLHTSREDLVKQLFT